MQLPNEILFEILYWIQKPLHSDLVQCTTVDRATDHRERQLAQACLAHLALCSWQFNLELRPFLYEHPICFSAKSLKILTNTLEKNPAISQGMVSFSVVSTLAQSRKRWWAVLRGRWGRSAASKLKDRYYTHMTRQIKTVLRLCPSLKLIHIDDPDPAARSLIADPSAMGPHVLHPDFLAQVPAWVLAGASVGPYARTPWVLDTIQALKLADNTCFDLDFFSAPSLTRLTLERCTTFWPLPLLLDSLPHLSHLTLVHNYLATSVLGFPDDDPAAGMRLLPYASTLRTVELLGQGEWRVFLNTEWHLFTQLEQLVAGGVVYDFEEDGSPGVPRIEFWTPEEVTLRMPASFQILTLASRDADTMWKTRVFFGAPSSAGLNSCPSNAKSTLTSTALSFTDGQCSEIVEIYKRNKVRLLLPETDGDFSLKDFHVVGLPARVEHPSREVNAICWRCRAEELDKPYDFQAELAEWEAWAITLP